MKQKGILMQRVGEIIQANTTEFTAQCYELYQSPPLGSLVKTNEQELELYAVVYQATTTSLEPGRHPIARGKNEANEEEIYRSSPQLEKLLRTKFSALVVGYRQDNKLYHYLPPKPARIHGFIYLCSKEEVKKFSSFLDFLNILINTNLPLPTDELIAACLRQMSQAYENRRRFLVTASKQLAISLSGQFNQLKAILEKIKE
jgi:hypothetical protein|tara:strand:- start:314 stop:919 length:606 start_codon:yes stop_codon:yes gene_type:complete